MKLKNSKLFNVSGGTITGIPGVKNYSTKTSINNSNYKYLDNSISKESNINVVMDKQGNILSQNDY
jgi:hypothetical protein